jgi:hypothetical protein
MAAPDYRFGLMHTVDPLPHYAGQEIPSEVFSLLDLLGEHGFTSQVTGGASKTVRIYRGEANVGYINSTVLQRGGVLGYHFALHGRAADACPLQLVPDLANYMSVRYKVSPDTLDVQSTSRHTYLIFRDPTAALRVLLQDAAIQLPEDTQIVVSDRQYFEGRLTDVTMHRRERSPKARAACLAAYGFSCQVCGVRLKAKYAGLTVELVHVHHEEPLGATLGEREFDPVASMKPVCPNCHAVIHARDPAYSIAEVRSMLTT